MKTRIFAKTQKSFFVIIDDLDRECVSNVIVYDLIKALIETVKDLSKIPNVKIIIAIRTNIHKKIFKLNKSRGVQREKYNHLYLDIRWSNNELRTLLNNRLRVLMKGTYTSDSPVVEDVFPESNRKQPSGFDYMLERSFMRPRDLIDFVNKCIKHADGRTRISREIIRLAEDEYSHERLKALNDEWLENYGRIFCLYGFLKGGEKRFNLDDITKKAEEHFLQIAGTDEVKDLSPEILNDFDTFGKDFDTIKLLKIVLSLLYEIGLIGIKLTPERKLEYIHESFSTYEPADFSDQSKFYIHPMFYKALRIDSKSSSKV